MKISIITPTHNREKIIERTITSILNQTYSDWELIIIDDGSSDNTLEFLKRYVNNKKIKVIGYKKNRGVNYARNRGIEMSSGDYITFLDSDDEFYENSLEVIVNYIKKYPKNKILNFITEFSKHKIKDKVFQLKYKKIIENKVANGEHLFVVKSDLKGELVFPETINGGESICWLKLAKKNNYIFIKEKVRNYNQDCPSLLRGNDQSIVSLKRSKKIYELYLKELGRELKKYNLYNKQGYVEMSINLGKVNILLGDLKEGWKNTKQGMFYNPLYLRSYRNIFLIMKKWGEKNVVWKTNKKI